MPCQVAPVKAEKKSLSKVFQFKTEATVSNMLSTVDALQRVHIRSVTECAAHCKVRSLPEMVKPGTEHCANLAVSRTGKHGPVCTLTSVYESG
jgi:hypothetical protein